MVETQISSRDVASSRVVEVMRQVPRHRFVPASRQASAYEDMPLPIGEGQTISQPYIVAKMTELAHIDSGDRVFELGTGSGYQAAVASRLASEVFTMEIHPSLAEHARATIADLGYRNVTVREGDGYYGWAEHAPFDAILVTAAATHIPPPLVEQLRPGGRMVVPVGPPFAVQRLMLVEKSAQGQIRTRALFAVRFVPVEGGHGGG
jgi:protein-L-isoaspartate(D-aspartate) O-methyltransferase